MQRNEEDVKETLRKIAVMQAWVDGKEVECAFKGDSYYVPVYPAWNWDTYDYRVKEVIPICLAETSKKKVKICTYIDKYGFLVQVVDGIKVSPDWEYLPDEDRFVEVQE